MTRRRLLSIGLSSFGPPRNGAEQPVGGWPDLPFVPARVDALVGALQRCGYACRRHDGSDAPGSAASLGQLVSDAITGAMPGEVLVVHVLSHGYIAPSGSLYVVGPDGVHDMHTSVDTWVNSVADLDPGPLTLFLLDICHAGRAARQPALLTAADNRSRAWVIAACGPGQNAFNGRFTEAAANVLGSLADGELDIDRSCRHVPLATVARQIRREVQRLASAAGGLPQQVTASLVDISADPLDLPFFVNSRFADSPRLRARAGVDRAVAPFIDEAFDPDHFLTRAAGQGELASGELKGCFTGRSRELKILAPWINLQDRVGLRVVTGSPGAGKSALLGVLICAAHPALREPTEPLWRDIEQAPYRNRHMAAVHARQRTPDQIVRSLARQFGVPLPAGPPSPAPLVEALAGSAEPPLIVIDALDEAVDAVSIMDDLLLPLARVQRGDGEPVRLLVGMRPWAELGPLRAAARQAGGLLDLDDVPAGRLRQEVQQYVARLLLTDPRWDRVEHEGPVRALARQVAETLTAAGAGREWGAFLVAGLFAHHVLNAYDEPIGDAAAALVLGASVPRTLPELLELDLRTRTGTTWLRPVLTALAHARGEGMPAQTVRQAAAAFVDGPHGPDTPTVLDALDAARFYLRQGAEVDGTTRYRLFHQGLADHLRDPANAGRVLDHLLAPLGVPERPGRRWDLAEPYLLRHAIQHAVEAGRTAELLADPGFLVAADPLTLLPELASATGTPAEPAVAVYQEVLDRAGYREAPEAGPTGQQALRRQLALAAVRRGETALARRFAEPPGGPPLPLAPVWVTGESPAASAPATTLTLHAAPSPAVGWGLLDGRPHGLVGTADGRVLAFEADSGSLVREIPAAHRGAVSTVGYATHHGQPVVLSGSSGSNLSMHSLTSGEQIDWPVTLPPYYQATAVATIAVASGSTAVTVTGGALRVWDTDQVRETGQRFFPMDARVVAACCTRIRGGAVVVTLDRAGVLTGWDLATPLSSVPLPGVPHRATVFACSDHASPNALVTGDEQGRVSVLGLDPDHLLSRRLEVHRGPVTAIGCAVAGTRVYVVSAGGSQLCLSIVDFDGRVIARNDITNIPARVTAIACGLAGDRLLVLTGGDRATIWSCPLGAAIRHPAERSHRSASLAAGGDGTRAVTAVAATVLGERPVALIGRAGGDICVADLVTGPTRRGELSGHAGAVTALCAGVLGGRQVVVSAGADRTVRLWDLATRRQVDQPIRIDDVATTVAVAGWAGVQVVLTGGRGGTAVWDPLTGQALARLGEHLPDTGSMCFVDGHLVTVHGGDDGAVWLQDRSTRHPLPAVPGKPVTAVATAQVDGLAVAATADETGVVVLWELAERRQLACLALPDPVTSLTLAPGGDLLVRTSGELYALRYGG